MKVDTKFNKRSAAWVDCNYTDVKPKSFVDKSEAITLRFYGTQSSGDLIARMNVLEAHRLVQQLNDALAVHAKVSIAKAVQP